jgi:hypothetical protein
MGKQRRNQDTPAAQAEALELAKRAVVAVERGIPAQAMADADAVMTAHAQAGPAGEPYLTARLWRAIAPGHPGWQVTVQTQLAVAELGLGMPGDAEARARETIAEAERLHGPAHWATLRAGTLLGSALARQGRPDEARQQLQANAEAWLEHFGEDHPRTIAAQEELARVSHDDG